MIAGLAGIFGSIVGSPFFFPFKLASSFFLPNPNSLRLPAFGPSPVDPPTSASMSLLSADFDTILFVDS